MWQKPKLKYPLNLLSLQEEINEKMNEKKTNLKLKYLWVNWNDWYIFMVEKNDTHGKNGNEWTKIWMREYKSDASWWSFKIEMTKNERNEWK